MTDEATNGTASLAKIVAGTVVSQGVLIRLLINKGIISASDMIEALEAEVSAANARSASEDVMLATSEMLSSMKARFPQD